MQFNCNRIAALGILTVGLLLARPATGQVTLLNDNFNGENGGSASLNYAGFANFNVMNGSVDLIGNGSFDFYPGNGLYVDLDGSTGLAGTLQSKTDFNLTAGTYTLQFDLGGSQRGDTNQVDVSLDSVYSESFIIASGDPLTTFVRTITVAADTTGFLSIHNLGGDDSGAILDNVSLIQQAPMSTPEPGSVALLVGMSLSGAGFLVRRCKNARKAA